MESMDECIPCGGKNNALYYDKPKPVPVTEGTEVAIIACGESFAMMVKDCGAELMVGRMKQWAMNNE